MVSIARTLRRHMASITEIVLGKGTQNWVTCEQLFHAWRSFTFDENTETIDSYVIRIRQVATLLGYGEPQILEVFKNTIPTKLYWILFPIEDLRQAVRQTVNRSDLHQPIHEHQRWDR